MANSNLDLSISANSGKLKADLEIAKQVLKEFGKEVTAAAREVAKGTGDPNRVQQLTRQWEQQGAVVRQLSGEYRKLSGDVDNTAQSFRGMLREGRGMRRLATEIAGLSGGISGITSLLGGLGGGFVGAFAGAAVGKALDFMLKGLASMSEALTKLQNQALQSGLPPIAMQAIGEAAKKVGLDAEVGTKSLETFSKTLDALRAKPDPTIQIVNGMAMVVPQIQKGASVTRDWSDSLAALGINFRKFPDTPQGKIDAYRAAIEKALALEARFPSQINRLSQDLFGAPIAVIRAMAGDIDKLNELIVKLMNAARGAGDPILQQLGQLKTAQGQVSTAFQELTAGYQRWLLASQTAANQWLASVLQNWPKSFAAALANMQANLSNWWNAAGPLIQAGLNNAAQNFTNWGNSIDATLTKLSDSFVKWGGETLTAALNNAAQNFTNWGQAIAGVFNTLWSTLTDGFNSFWNSLTQTASAALDGLLQKVTAVVDYVKSAIASIGSAIGTAAAAGAPVGPGGFASGGAVRGPGTATSDSILARLSNGEFVMRAAAVQHWGAGMLAAMNSAGTPRFADGGLVAAGGGTGRAVHLHLGGHEFALSGAGNVVDALVTESHRQRMRSGGLKPSWYGGRVSG